MMTLTELHIFDPQKSLLGSKLPSYLRDLLEELKGFENLQKLYVGFLKFRFYFIFRWKGREGEREGKKHQCVVASRMPPTRDLVHNPGMCLD